MHVWKRWLKLLWRQTLLLLHCSWMAALGKSSTALPSCASKRLKPDFDSAKKIKCHRQESFNSQICFIHCSTHQTRLGMLLKKQIRFQRDFFFLPIEKGKTLQENIQQRFKKRWQVWQMPPSLTGTGIIRNNQLALLSVVCRWPTVQDLLAVFTA